MKNSQNDESTRHATAKPAAQAAGVQAWHMLAVEAVKDRLQTDVARGLASAEATQRLAQYGPNTLAQAPERSTWAIFLAQFRSLIVALLVAATVVAFAMGDNIEAVAILVVIVINAGIGFLTEWKAEQALSAVQKQSVRVAHVLREGAESEIPAADLVPGDLVVLAAGARVPADGRIVESARLQIEEAALTGESHAVTKTSELLQDKGCSTWRLTEIASGSIHKVAELPKQVAAVVGTGRRFWMILDAEGRQTAVPHPGNCIVVKIAVRDFQRSRQRRFIHCKPVVLSSDLDDAIQ